MWLEADDECRPMDIAALADIFATKEGGWRKKVQIRKSTHTTRTALEFQGQIIDTLGIIWVEISRALCSSQLVACQNKRRLPAVSG